MKILLATANQGKVREVEELLKGEDIEVLSLKDFPDYQDIEETGRTFTENALIKAKAACGLTQMITLADDSGLEVDALGGAPGVYSARYAGEPKDDERNIDKLLHELRSTPGEVRSARFRCSLAIVTPDGEEIVTEGSVEGMILFARKGTGGFGYDPLFYLPKYKKSMAQLTVEEKNQISHRAQAFRKAVTILKEIASKG